MAAPVGVEQVTHRTFRRLSLILLTALALVPPLLLLAPVGIVFWAFPSTRDRGAIGFCGETVRWKQGEVGLCDHSTFPGSYGWKVEWHGDGGKRKVLLEIGNDDGPAFRVVPPEELLEVVYCRRSEESMRYETPMIATFRSLEGAPVIADNGVAPSAR